MSARNPFAYKLDYAAAIAEDNARIARLTAPEAVAASAHLETIRGSLPYVGNIGNGADFLLCAFEGTIARAAILGIDAETLACFLLYTETDGNERFEGYPMSNPVAWYKQGKAACEAVTAIPVDVPEVRAAALKHARASLARHTRNGAKQGYT